MDKFCKLSQTYAMRNFAWAVLLLAGLAGCDSKPTPHIPSLPPVSKSGELVVVTRDSPTTYYEDAEGKPAGLEHDLVQLFADELGVRVRFIVVNQFNQIWSLVETHQAHLAAASLGITPERQKRFKFASPYQTVQVQVAYNTNSKEPRGIKDLIGKRIEVVAGSSYAEKLREAREAFPALKWVESATKDSEDLLESLAQGTVHAVVTDSNTVSVTRNFHPEIDVAFDLSDNQPLAWAFPKDVERSLFDKAQAFFARIRQDGTLKRLLDRYYGHVKRLERADVEGFMAATNSALPKLRYFFHYSQDMTELDWRLIAAVGYQESHWNPLATSATGVRGLMMLTNDTADRMGVTNRLDPMQNILAGARYMQYLKDSVPERIAEPDRTWIGLAAYNVGYGHVEDARVLAQKLKLNPDSWTDLKATLPLLAKSEYHSEIKHGYARGGEAVIFVENIRTYYDILARLERPYQPIFQSQDLNVSSPGPAQAKLIPQNYSLATVAPSKKNLGLRRQTRTSADNGLEKSTSLKPLYQER